MLSIWFIGLYEGVYNHLFKNLLFFAGVNGQTMASLFPPPMYEMPNDFLFELTGVLQALLRDTTWVLFHCDAGESANEAAERPLTCFSWL